MLVHVARSDAQAQLGVQRRVHELPNAHRAEVAIDPDPDPGVASERDVARAGLGRAVAHEREGVDDAVGAVASVSTRSSTSGHAATARSWGSADVCPAGAATGTGGRGSAHAPSISAMTGK